MNFKEELDAKAAAVEHIIEKYLPEEKGYQKTVIEAMNYSVLAGGKRLRPMLLQETYRMFGGEGEMAEPFMAALEMVHTYSLVHDDLPCMDDDEYRRGRKTTHVVYGEGMAVLAGDGLLNYAFETAVKAFGMAKDGEEFRRVAKALGIFARKAGIYGMIGGQTADVEAEMGGSKHQDFIVKSNRKADAGAEIGGTRLQGGIMKSGQTADAGAEMGSTQPQPPECIVNGGQEADIKADGQGAENPGQGITEDLLLFIHGHKTAALIQSAMMVGAVLAGAGEEEIRRVEDCAYRIGLAFQIQDDILDVTSSLEVLGKAAGSDEKNQKCTYVTLKGIGQSKKDVERLSEEAISIIASFPGQNEFLAELVKQLVTREK